MSDVGIGTGKVVVNRAMSLDGFIAGPGDAMDWIFDFMAPDAFPGDRGCHRRLSQRPTDLRGRQEDEGRQGGRVRSE